MFEELFKPGRIGKMSVKNRIFMTPMGTGSMQNPDGGFSERLRDYYEARAKGGTGLIITGSTLMTRVTGSEMRKSLSTVFYDQSYVGGASEMCDAVHRWGAKVCIQLTPGDGRLWSFAGETPVSSSDGLPTVFPPKALSRAATIGEIKRIIDDYRKVAYLCKLAGFDAIEIRAYGGYFTDQFMTAAWNKRTDEYGGDLDGRLRLLMEMVRAVKEGAGADYPLIVKISPVHYFDGGRIIEEGVEIARRLEAAGVHAIHVEKGSYENWWEVIPPAHVPLANQLDVAEAIKKAVKIPVMAHGKLGIRPELAERALKDGKADFVGLGRSLLADPEWPNKVKEGRLQDIRPCIGCQMGCINRIFESKYISCAVNPQTGNERERRFSRAKHRKSVLVIGGGPGGMEAALVAALRGHDVTLLEKKAELGGALRPAGAMPFKLQMEMLRQYYVLQLAKAGVNVECGVAATVETVLERRPDAVVVATGARPRVPRQIPGIQGPNVCTAEQVLLGQRPVAELGPKVVIAGGGELGCEMAVYLGQSRPDLDITVVEMLPEIAIDSFVNIKWYLERRLKELGVKVMTKTEVVGIGEKNVEIEADGSRRSLGADAVVVALGYESDDSLAKELEGKIKELYTIGDCTKPGKVIGAVWEGYEAGRTI